MKQNNGVSNLSPPSQKKSYKFPVNPENIACNEPMHHNWNNDGSHAYDMHSHRKKDRIRSQIVLPAKETSWWLAVHIWFIITVYKIFM